MATLVAGTGRPARLSRAALEGFVSIADRWRLKRGEARALLGGVSPSTYDRWLKKPAGAALGADALERVSHVLGIYKALHVMFPAAAYADGWIREPNAAFGGVPALERMLTGFTGLVEVRRYLDAERGW